MRKLVLESWCAIRPFCRLFVVVRGATDTTAGRIINDADGIENLDLA